MSKFNQIEYIREYNKQKYKTVKLYAPPDWYAEMKQHAAAHGESVNAFMLRAAAEQMKRDQAEAEPPRTEAAPAPEPEPPTPETPTEDAPTVRATAPEDQAPDEPPKDDRQAPERSAPTTPKPRRGRPPKQPRPDPAQLTLDSDAPTDGNSDSGDQ